MNDFPVRSSYEFLREKECFIFDIDGTVAWGNRPIPEAVTFILRLRETGRRVIFYTNNPNRSHAQAADYLNAMGFQTTPDEIVSSEDVAFAYLRKHHPNGKIFLLGVPEMEANFARAGFDLVGMDAERADVVLVGFDQSLTYDKITKAIRLLLGGAVLLGTHPDRITPGSDGMMLDCGSICEMLAFATGTRPCYLGKPTSRGLPLIKRVSGLDADKMCMVGDRLYTDVAFGNNSGMTSLLVLTGGTGRDEALAASGVEKPDVILPHLGYVTELLD